jgi:hypothetical protein
MPRAPVVGAVLLASLALAREARADLTGFAGVVTSPAVRPALGLSAGITLLVIGFEFEFSDAREDVVAGAPSLRIGTGSLIVQTPMSVSGLQFYGVLGGGIYRERLQETQETHFAAGVGGGVKVSLAGPLRLRIDYRVFRLRGTPLHARPQRV